MMRVFVNVNVVVMTGCFALSAITADAQDLPLPVADLQRTEPVDFSKEIMPILKRHCLACHHEKEAEGGLVLETIKSIHQGGDSGPALVANDAAASLLMARASGAEEPLMPPDDNDVGAKPLTPAELGLLKLWIQQGASGGNTAVSESIAWQPIPESIRTVYAMDVSPDGQFAAIGRGNRVVVIELSNHTEIARLVDANLAMGDVADVDLVRSIAFSPDARRIATGGFRTLRIWKKTPSAVDLTSNPLAAAAGLIAVKSDESAAAIVNAIGDIEVWDLTNNQRLHTMAGHADGLSGLVWAGDTDRIYSCDPTGRLIAWQASTGTKMFELDAKTALVTLSASRNGADVAAIDADGNVQFFRVSPDGKSTESVHDAAGELSVATAVTFTEQPTPMAIVASQVGGVMMIDLADHKLIRQVDRGAAVDALAVTHDQTKLVTGGRDGTTRIWNIADGKPILTMTGDPDSRLQVASGNRDVIRQKAAVARLNGRTAELENELATESEALVKVTQEYEKAAESVAAEDQKRVDALALVSATEAKIAKSTSDATIATETIAVATNKLATERSAVDAIAKEIETQTAALTSAQEAVATAQDELSAITEARNDAQVRAERIRKTIAQRHAAMEKAKESATSAQNEIDTAIRMATEAKATAEQAAIDLETQRKNAAAAEDSKQKSEVELAKRRQVFDAATSAQQRAAAAIPQHTAIIDSESRRLRLLDQQLARRQIRMTGPGNEVVSVAISRDDATVATAHRDGSVRVYRASDGQPISSFQPQNRSGQSHVVCLGQLIFGFGISPTPSIWSGRVEWVLERTIGSIDDTSTISDRVTALDFRPDGMSIAVGSGPPSRFGDVKVFSVESGQVVRDFGEVHSDTVLGLEFSPDGRQLASAAADKTIRLLNIATQRVDRSLEGHTHHVLSVAWQDDGQTIASTSADRSVKIWNIESGEQRRTIKGFSKEITDAAFVQSTNQIVTACADGRIRLSDTSNGNSIRTFDAPDDFLFTLSVTPDGKRLLAGGHSGIVRIWDLDDGKLLHEVK